MRAFILYFFIVFLIISIPSCEREKFITDSSATLQFSEDAIIFDTVFTTIGSVTKQLKVYNRYNKSIRISSINLSGRDGSYFRLNIDGLSSDIVEDIELSAEDSLIIFVEVTVDPAGQDNPLLVQDSIVFLTNGNIQDVDLVAWGQDVHLKKGEVIDSEIWGNDKPYLVYDSLIVNAGETLILEAGAKVYFHRKAFLHVNGTLQALGEVMAPVLFCGDRLEKLYEDIPGQWQGIFLKGEGQHILHHVVIKNAINGVWAGDDQNAYRTGLRAINCIIKNMTSSGIFAENARILMGNSVVANCYNHALSLTSGGYYEFYHCTFANYPDFIGILSSAVLLNNYYLDDENLAHGVNLEKAYFGNSIIYGPTTNEINFDNQYNGATIPSDFNYLFESCLIRIQDSVNTSDTASYKDILKNESPGFLSVEKEDFRLDSVSVAINRGSLDVMNKHPFLLNDIMGVSRLIFSPPDMGAYENTNN